MHFRFVNLRGRRGSLSLVACRRLSLVACRRNLRARRGSLSLVACRRLSLVACRRNLRARRGSLSLVACRRLSLVACRRNLRARRGSLSLMACRQVGGITCGNSTHVRTVHPQSWVRHPQVLVRHPQEWIRHPEVLNLGEQVSYAWTRARTHARACRRVFAVRIYSSVVQIKWEVEAHSATLHSGEAFDSNAHIEKSKLCAALWRWQMIRLGMSSPQQRAAANANLLCPVDQRAKFRRNPTRCYSTRCTPNKCNPTGA